MFIEILEPAADVFIIGNPQIVTTEFGPASVEKIGEGFYNAKICDGKNEFARTGASREQALINIRSVMRNLRQIETENF